MPKETLEKKMKEKEYVPIYIKRRLQLTHGDNCPMRCGVQYNCNCHYDDCLNDGNIYKECICWILNGSMKWVSAMKLYDRLPWWKKAFALRPFELHFQLEELRIMEPEIYKYISA
jgi:hypothetical protein